MSAANNVVDGAEVVNKTHVPNFLGDIVKSIQTGHVFTDPNMLLGLGLFVVAGLVLLSCIVYILFRRSSSGQLDEGAAFKIESRLQALEMALADQRNLVMNMKTQSKSDFGYFKQEVKMLQGAIDELQHEIDSVNKSLELKIASNY